MEGQTNGWRALAKSTLAGKEIRQVSKWKIDTVIDKGHSGLLVSIVERRMKFTVLAQVTSNSAVDVTETTIRLLRPYKELVHTMTAGNGEKFAHDEKSVKH
jgi:IS30 family transposase